MVNYKKIVEELEKYKPITLFAVAQMDELINTWSIIFAANWVDENNSDDIYKRISDLIDTNGTKEDVTNISRIGIFNDKHYLIQGLLKYSGENELKDVRVNGNTIHMGHIYYPPAKVAILK